MPRQMYAVMYRAHGPTRRHAGLDLWCRATTKRAALAYARRRPGAEVYAMPASPGAWDAPTFRACSTMIHRTPE